MLVTRALFSELNFALFLLAITNLCAFAVRVLKTRRATIFVTNTTTGMKNLINFEAFSLVRLDKCSLIFVFFLNRSSKTSLFDYI